MRLGFNLEAKVPIFLGGTWIHGDNFPLGLMINISSILFRKEYQIKNLFELPFAGGFLPKPWNQFTKRQFFASKRSWTPTLDAYFTWVHGISTYGFLGVRRSPGGGVFEWIRESLEDPRSKMSFFQSSSFQTSNSKFETSTAHWLAFFKKPIHSITRQRPNASWLQKNARDRWIRKEGGTWRCCRKWNWKAFWEVTALMIWTAPRWWVARNRICDVFFVVWFFFLGAVWSCRIAFRGSWSGSICNLCFGSDLMVWNQWLVSWKNYHGKKPTFSVLFCWVFFSPTGSLVLGVSWVSYFSEKKKKKQLTHRLDNPPFDVECISYEKGRFAMLVCGGVTKKKCLKIRLPKIHKWHSLF